MNGPNASDNKLQSSSKWLVQSLRLLHHELRRGELTIVFLAVVLAVATVFSLTGFSEQIKQAIFASSTNTIAADRVLRSGRAVSDELIHSELSANLSIAKKLETESMAFAGDNMLLSEITAVSNTYPLRGELVVKRTLDGASEVVGAPEQGKVWVEPSVLSRLDTKIGAVIDVGATQFTIAGIVTDIPDRSYRAFIAGPTIMLNIHDVEASKLVQPGSRVTYKYLFAGEPDDVVAYEAWIKPNLNEAQRWYDAKMAQNRLSRILDNAEKFLSLASMLGIVLAAVAVAVASRRYGQRHQSSVAVFKALGATQSYVRKLYILHWTLLSTVSITVGLVVGYILLLAGINAIESYLSLAESSLSATPFIVAIFTGFLCAIAFSIAPMKSLVETSPMLVIRGIHAKYNVVKLLTVVIPISALFLLLWVFSQDLIMSAALLAGGLLVSAILLVIANLLMNAGRSVGSKAGKSWHLALANLKRRASENSVQLVSFTIAIQLLLLIIVMKSSLISEWEAQFPPNTPNHYLINVDKSDVADLQRFADENGVQNEGFAPVYRGRLSAINGENTVEISDDDEEQQQSKANESEASASSDSSENESTGRRGLGRELGLTWMSELPVENTVTKGQWWQIDDETPQVSISQGIAERLEVDIGDVLTFDMGTRTFDVPVTSIREVNWQSRQLNFVMIFNEAAFKGQNTTYIAAWKIEASQRDLVYKHFINYPSITLMDFGAIMKQLNKMIDQVAIAIELILVLVVLAGSLVLVAQVQASMEERERELAILRTLGAKGTLLRNSILFEFVALGAIAGFMASLAMELAVYALQSQVFDMNASLHIEYWFIGMAAGAGFVGLIGMLSCWRLLNLSSVTLIRRTM